MSRYRHIDPEDLPSGFCSACHEECTAISVDMGIGAYEFWGSREVHVDIQAVSPCCEAEMLEYLPEEEDEE